MKKQKTLTIQAVIKNITEAFDSLSGNEIADIHNQICAKKIEYDGDNVWTYTGEDDGKQECNVPAPSSLSEFLSLTEKQKMALVAKKS